MADQQISELLITPNPAEDNVLISFFVMESDRVKMTLTDQLGNEVKTLINTYLPNGMYQLNFNISDFQSGIYYCTVQTKDIYLIEKLIVIK